MSRAFPEVEWAPGLRATHLALLPSACLAALLIFAAPTFGAGGNFNPGPTSPVPAGSVPASIAVGDFNGDGRPDLAAANQFSLDVTILLGDGAGNFAPAATSPEAAGLRPTAVVIGDFNGDLKPDLAVSNSNSNDVTILLGVGNGDFSAAASSPETAVLDPASIAVADFDGNGKQDLAVANKTNSVAILLGDGSGDFSAAAGSPEAAGAGPESIAAGDFDGNGKQDLAVANISSNNVTILLGDGSGNFNPAATSPEAAGVGPRSVVVGDFDGNARADLAVANGYTNDVTILLGDGSGNFNPAATSPAAAGNIPSSLATGDFDADGRQDLAVANNGPSQTNGGGNIGGTTVLLGDGSGNFSPAATSPEVVGFNPRSVAVSDFDANGLQDLAVANGGSNDISILLGGPEPIPLGPADGDADGVPDADDLCDLLVGSAPSGCPSASRRLTLARSGDAFKGRLTSDVASCRARQKVTIFRRAPGPDNRIGSPRTKKSGSYKLKKPASPGSYYATVTEQTIPDTATCLGVEVEATEDQVAPRLRRGSEAQRGSC